MATKTGIDLKKTDKGWEAPCGCVFHIFDGLPILEKASEVFIGQTSLVGKLEPHLHPCLTHTPNAGYEAIVTLCRRMLYDNGEIMLEAFANRVEAELRKLGMDSLPTTHEQKDA